MHDTEARAQEAGEIEEIVLERYGSVRQPEETREQLTLRYVQALGSRELVLSDPD